MGALKRAVTEWSANLKDEKDAFECHLEADNTLVCMVRMSNGEDTLLTPPQAAALGVALIAAAAVAGERGGA